MEPSRAETNLQQHPSANYMDIYDSVHIHSPPIATNIPDPLSKAALNIANGQEIPSSNHNQPISAYDNTQCHHANPINPDFIADSDNQGDFGDIIGCNPPDGDLVGGISNPLAMGDNYVTADVPYDPFYPGYNAAPLANSDALQMHTESERRTQVGYERLHEDYQPTSHSVDHESAYRQQQHQQFDDSSYQRLDENENVDNIPSSSSGGYSGVVQDEQGQPLPVGKGYEGHNGELTENSWASKAQSTHASEYGDQESGSLDKGEGEVMGLTEEEELGLYQAAMEGQMDAVKTLIRHGEADEVVLMSDEQGEKGRTMLHAAVHAHCTDVVSVLLEHGASPDVQDVEGETPLHLAVKLAYVDMVEVLVTKGANVNIEDEQGRTPLQICLNIDKPTTPSDAIMINMLLPSTDFSICDFDGVSPLHCLAYWDLWAPLEGALQVTGSAVVKDNRGRTPLHYCFLNPNLLALDAAYILIRADASIVMKDFDGRTAMHRLMAHSMTLENHDAMRFIRDFICMEIKNNEGHSLLHLSTIGVDSEMVKFLCQCGADMDDKDREQNTALHIAVTRNHSEMVKTLLYCGANPNVQDTQQQGPLHLAAANSRLTAAKLLLAEEAEVDLRDERGRTALHIAVYAGSLEMVRLLTNNDANVNATDFTDSLPLHYAVTQDKYEICDLLLTKKSQVNASDIDGRTPLHLAVRTGNGDLLRMLIIFGAYVNEYDRFGQTPLHIAAELGKSEAVQTLMNRGANERLRDAEGKKAEQVAEDKGSMRVMKVMKEHRDSMIMYSKENLMEEEVEETVPAPSGPLSKSMSSLAACVSHQALDDLHEDTEDLVDDKPTHNGMASLSKLDDDSELDGPCGCCRVQ